MSEQVLLRFNSIHIQGRLPIMENDTSIDISIVKIRQEPTELCKILKFENLVGSGGEAKSAIAEGHVLVNGAVETRKRKKIVSGDVIEFAGRTIRIIAD